LSVPAHPLAAELDHILAHTEALWRDVSGCRVCITGGTGFVGTWLLESLVWANHNMQAGLSAEVLSRNPKGFLARFPHLGGRPDVRFLAADIRSPVQISRCDALVHAAAESDAQRNAADPLAMLDTIVTGTRNVLDAAVSANSERVLLLSSGAVYGPQPTDLERISEDFPQGPRLDDLSSKSLYGEGKRVMEMLGLHYARLHGCKTSIARCFAFLGPHLPLDRHFAAGNFLRDAHLGRTVAVSGDGRAVRSYMHPADLAIWLWTMLFRGRSGRAYNVGSDVPVTVGELAQRIAEHAPTHPPVEILRPPNEGPPERYVPDTRRAREELGMTLTIPSEQAIERTLAWLHRVQQ